MRGRREALDGTAEPVPAHVGAVRVAFEDVPPVAVPKPADTLIVSLANVAGERVCVLSVPMAERDGQVVEPPDSDNLWAEIAELMDG